MLSRKYFGLPLPQNDSEDNGTLILYPSDDEFAADCNDEIRIPLEPKADSNPKDPRGGNYKPRPITLPVPTSYLNKNLQKKPFTKRRFTVRAIIDDARDLDSKLDGFSVDSHNWKEYFDAMSIQAKSLITRARFVKGTQAAMISRVLSETAVLCLKLITHKMSSCSILDSSHASVRKAMKLLRLFVKHCNGCGREELECAAENVAWFLAVQLDRSPPGQANLVVDQLLAWRRVLYPFPCAWEVVQCALRQRLLEQMLTLRETDDIGPILIPWYRVIDSRPIADAASLWISKFSISQLRQCPAQLSRNLKWLRVALRMASYVARDPGSIRFPVKERLF